MSNFVVLLPATLAGLAADPQGESRELGGLLDFMPGVTIWTWLAFLLALPLMWKFVYGPIVRALEERDGKVEDAIEAAEKARADAESQIAAARAELEKARGEARRMVEEATSRAERQAAEALREAKEEAKAQLERARDDIAAEKRSALMEIRQEVVGLTISATGAILRKDIDDDTHRQMVQDFLSSMDSGSLEGNKA
jgi:F-type H+-transporting ATPase subunit b